MKSFRWTLVFGVLVAALVAFTVFDYKRSTKQEEQKQKDLSVLRYKGDELAKLEIITRMGATVLEKKDGKWRVTAPLQDVADEQGVGSFLSAIESEKITDTVAEGAGVDLATYGLKDPVTRLKVTSQAGKTQEIKIGSVKAYDQNLYAQIDDEPKVLLVGSSWDTHLVKRGKDFRDKHVYRTEGTAAAKPPDIKRVVIRQSAPGFPAELELVKTGEAWRVTKGGGKPNDDYPVLAENVTSLLEQIKALRAVDFQETPKTDKAAFQKAGLGKPAVEVLLFEGPDKKEPFHKLTIAPPAKPEDANLNAVSSDLDTIVVVFKAAIDQFRKRADDFYDKKKPFQFTVADVAKVKVEAKDLKAEFVKKGDSWAMADSGLQKEPDAAKLKDLVEKLNRLEAVRVLEPVKPGSPLKGESRIVLSKEDGSKVFELRWGELIREKAAQKGQPEAQYLAAVTDKTDRMVGVPEHSVKAFELSGLIKAPPKGEAKK